MAKPGAAFASPTVSAAGIDPDVITLAAANPTELWRFAAGVAVSVAIVSGSLLGVFPVVVFAGATVTEVLAAAAVSRTQKASRSPQLLLPCPSAAAFGVVLFGVDRLTVTPAISAFNWVMILHATWQAVEGDSKIAGARSTNGTQILRHASELGQLAKRVLTLDPIIVEFGGQGLYSTVFTRIGRTSERCMGGHNSG